MSVIDCHVHLYPPAVNRHPAAWAARHQESHWAKLCTRQRKDGRPVQLFPNVSDLLRAMDTAGVTRAVLLGWYWEHSATCAAQNRFYARCLRAHPDRLTAFATLQPTVGREKTLAEMRRCREEGMVGLGELSPHSQGYRVDDASFGAVLQLAAKWRWPVTLHVTDPASGNYPGRMETPLNDFVWLARSFSRTTFVLAHWGGRLPLNEAKTRTLPNVYYDTAASPLLYGEEIWRQFLAAVPAERVLFGSDYPLNSYPRIDAEPNLGRLVTEAHRAIAKADQLQLVVRGNAERVILRRSA